MYQLQRRLHLGLQKLSPLAIKKVFNECVSNYLKGFLTIVKELSSSIGISRLNNKKYQRVYYDESLSPHKQTCLYVLVVIVAEV